MKNIFAKFQEYVKKPNRNTFDLQYRNNLTTKFGQLTPVFCKEVIPGDSFKIDTKFGLMLMPMKFPVQTPMKAYIHYFYVRNRTTWKDWQDFIGGTKENLVPPYVQPLDKEKFYRVGGLADYLGIPDVLYNVEVPQTEFAYNGYLLGIESVDVSSTDAETGGFIRVGKQRSNDPRVYPYADTFFKDETISFTGTTADLSLITNATILGEINNKNVDGSFFDLTTDSYRSLYTDQLTHSGSIAADSPNYAYQPMLYLGDYSYAIDEIGVLVMPSPYRAYLGTNYQLGSSSNKDYRFFLLGYKDGKYNSCQQIDSTMTLNSSGNGEFTLSISDDIKSAAALVGSSRFKLAVLQRFWDYANTANGDRFIPITGDWICQSDGGSSSPFKVVGSTDLSVTPYDSDIHLSALPFRAYEAIYNAYYRNPQNNPFILNGVPEYNRYITTYDGGADTTQYDLYFRNWEYDFLTSAVQSPQQGIAPLVGMSMTGEATFADEDGNTYYAQAILNDEGEITGWQSHSSNMPAGSLRLLMDMAGTGISINDLRNVNAFQRFLENNIRHGLKYRDQIMSHFGVNVRYDELDMPEFLGGCSAEMEVYKVTQTSNSGDTPLGSFVGQAQVKKEYGHSVTKYCDEHGFIIGIMSIVPVPVYSQLLPKFFTKSTQLDYFFPEFGHIGYQPILQKEVSPLQTFYSSGDLNKVFGYNRAWYDYLASTDEVHGQFRTTMRDFIMNRTFADEPELGEDFLLVDPDQLNDVFLAGTEDDDLYAPEADKIIGSLLFNVSAKRPIPLFGIPKLEA